jgi:hypothetical protein
MRCQPASRADMRDEVGQAHPAPARPTRPTRPMRAARIYRHAR